MTEPNITIAHPGVLPGSSNIGASLPQATHGCLRTRVQAASVAEEMYMMVLGGVRRELDMMSAGIRGCSEKSTSFRALFWALELNEKIFSAQKQALSPGMRYPAVPLFLYKSYFTAYIQNRRECTFPRKVRQVKPGEGGWYVKE